MLSARSHEAKLGVNGGKGTGGAAGRVHWSAAETVAPEGREAPCTCLVARHRPGRPGEQQRAGHIEALRTAEAVRITAGDSGG